MSQRKKTSFLIALLLIFSFITPIFVSGFINIQRAEDSSRKGDYKTASVFYAQAAKIFFWQSSLWEKAGIASAQAGDYSDAIFYIQKSNSLSEEGWVWLGTAYFQTGNVTNAISAFEKGLQTYNSATLYRLLASTQRTQKNWEAEKSALENQLKIDSNDAYAHYRFGLLLTLFNPDLAYAELQNASTLNAEVDSAVQTLITALNIADTQNNEGEKYVTIGRALGLVQEWDLALVAFEKAIELDNQNAEAWAWLGEAKQQLGQDGRAELDKALMLNRTSPNVRALRALYWTRQEKYEQVLAEYSLANEYDPTNPAWLAGIGEAHTKLGDLISALEAYQSAVELAPADATYWRLLAMFCADNNFYIEEIGLPSAQQAVSLASNDAANQDALGYIYYLSGRHANAELSFLQAIELSPEYFPAHLHLALNYIVQGNRPAAFNALTYVRDADTSGLYRESALDLLNKYFP
ncbi:MAG: tetratricopeptide repeat protein [Anaerolineales bacterium]|nr:tetratricopeptide repeat protein [Anaerolineales bacterium]